jgi:23S rRNA pseudouridine1911/1915/1917 synthase
MNILYEDNHLLVIEKPINVPTQADASGDADVLSLAKAYLKSAHQKPGNVYCGLVHRLDRPVGGVMVLAKTSKAARRLSDQVRTHVFEKEYHAVLAGPAPVELSLMDYLIKDPSTNTTRIGTPEDGKRSELSFEVLQHAPPLSLVRIALKSGRSHQIRVQFAARHAPLWGDQRYNPQAKPKQQLALWASELRFLHPTTHAPLTFSVPLPAWAPWNLFKR